MSPRDVVLDRSGAQCEAMVEIDFQKWTRCGTRPVEVHHVLTRARGGAILDSVGETYHLMALCKYHHTLADGEHAYAGDLLIDGYVTTEGDQVVYTGTDEYLSKKYPRQDRRIESA